jgi:hypothetical protein
VAETAHQLASIQVAAKSTRGPPISIASPSKCSTFALNKPFSFNRTNLLATALTATDLQKHREAIEKGGASKEGPMTGTDLEEHRALMAQGYTEKHRLMMQLANGNEGQENLWKCFDSNHGTAVLYHFRADNEPTIDGVRQFEKYLLDDQNGFVPGKLTTAGAEAHNALKRMCANADRDNASRERKKNRQGK